jgi:oligo-1,6-glucosidase
MAFQFEGVGYGYPDGDKFKLSNPDDFKLSKFKEIYTKWDSVFENKGWGTIFLANHDQPRMLTRRGNDAPEYRDASSKMLTTFILTMRGTPYYYYGDEIGMSNIKFDNIKDYNDIETLNHYKLVQSQHGNLKEFMEAQKFSARDNGRTPMQWDATTNAGFTTGTPWLKVNPNYTTVNVAAQEKDPNSILNYFRKMIQLRKNNKTLVYGKYVLLDKDNEKIYAYTRGDGAEKLLVVLNWSKDKVDWNIPSDITVDAQPLINNVAEFNLKAQTISLQPYQALVLKVVNGK